LGVGERNGFLPGLRLEHVIAGVGEQVAEDPAVVLLVIDGEDAQLLEQPDVLDGDHRLIGEVLEQGDLLVGEWADLVAANVDRSERDPSFNRGTQIRVRWPNRRASALPSGNSSEAVWTSFKWMT